MNANGKLLFNLIYRHREIKRESVLIPHQEPSSFASAHLAGYLGDVIA